MVRRWGPKFRAELLVQAARSSSRQALRRDGEHRRGSTQALVHATNGHNPSPGPAVFCRISRLIHLPSDLAHRA